MEVRAIMPFYPTGLKSKSLNGKTNGNNVSEYSQINTFYDKTGIEYPKNYNVSFGRFPKVHESWGANIVKIKNGFTTIKFKVWAPFAESIKLELRNAADKLYATQDEKTKLWNINAQTPNDGKSRFVNLRDTGGKIFEGIITVASSATGIMYRYHRNKDGEEKPFKDPISKAQDHIYSWSRVYDNKNYKWHDGNWQAGEDPRRVSALAGKSTEYLRTAGFDKAKIKLIQKMLPYSAMSIKEIHIPTLTQEGTLEALKGEIDKIAEEGIFNSVLLMPVEGTYGHNWGYDGVDKYSVSQALSSNGEEAENSSKRNDMLKSVIDYAHGKGINVGIDWVPSHIFDIEGAGQVLDEFGPYIKREGKWGGRAFKTELNSESESPLSPEELKRVRDYLINIPYNWAKNYHFDFIRTDQTPELGSTFTIKQISAEMRHHFPHLVIQSEDQRNDIGLTQDLLPHEIHHGNEVEHDNFITKLDKNESEMNAHLGSDEHWDFGFSHAMEAILENRTVDGFSPNVYTLVNAMKDIRGTKYFTSHDETGNDTGSRLMIKIIAHRLGMFNPGGNKVKHRGTEQRTAVRTYLFLVKAYKLFSEAKTFEEFEKEYNKLAKMVLNPGVNIPATDFAKAVKIAQARHKNALGLVWLAPGSKMIFQGDEYGEINLFRFSREMPYKEKSLEYEKGFDFATAHKSAKLNPERNTNQGILNVSKAFSDLLKRNDAMKYHPGMSDIDAMFPYIDEQNGVIAVKRFNHNGNVVVAFVNTGDKPLENYLIPDAQDIFSYDTWKETINTNAEIFGGDGTCNNSEKGFFNIGDKGTVPINIPANSTVVFEKTDETGKVLNGTPLFERNNVKKS